MSDEVTQIISVASVQQEQSAFACLIVIAGSNVGRMYRLSQLSDLTLGRSEENTISIVEDGVSRFHCRLRTIPSGDILLEDLKSTNGTYVNGVKVSRRLLEDGDKIQVGSISILKFTMQDEVEEDFQRHMYESALRDGLTQAYNKRYFIERLDSEFAYSVRHETSLTLVMIDLDHFKKINDTYGHLAGDAVLIEMSKRINRAIRTEDVFARYGGEEFALIARGIPQQNGLILAERLRTIIRAQPFLHGETRLEVTASLGVVTVPHHPAQNPTAMIEMADQALYKAKRSGRDRVCTL